MKAAIISDIHLLVESKDEALQNLKETVSEMKAHNPDLVIVLGDMIGNAVTEGKSAEKEKEGVEELVSIKKAVEDIDSEKIYVLGNHEQDIDREKFSREFGQETYGHKQVEEEDFIYLDSSAPELSGSRGQVSREQLDFLDEKLEELDEAFLVIHHPVHYRDLSHSYYWDIYPERAFCGNKKEINNIIERHGNVKAVFNAHIHDLELTEFKDNVHFTNPPFISESRRDGFNQYFTVAEIGEKASLKIFRRGELENTFQF